MLMPSGKSTYYVRTEKLLNRFVYLSGKGKWPINVYIDLFINNDLYSHHDFDV